MSHDARLYLAVKISELKGKIWAEKPENWSEVYFLETKAKWLKTYYDPTSKTNIVGIILTETTSHGLKSFSPEKVLQKRKELKEGFVRLGFELKKEPRLYIVGCNNNPICWD